MVSLRKVEKDDIDLLFQWANDSVVRNNSFSTKAITYEEHEEWFNKVIDSENIMQFIMMCDEVPVGQIRISVYEGIGEISYSIATNYRGFGYGHIILKLLKETIEKEYPGIKRLIAKVKPDNLASRKLFEDAGYIAKSIEYDIKLKDNNL